MKNVKTYCHLHLTSSVTCIESNDIIQSTISLHPLIFSQYTSIYEVQSNHHNEHICCSFVLKSQSVHNHIFSCNWISCDQVQDVGWLKAFVASYKIWKMHTNFYA